MSNTYKVLGQKVQPRILYLIKISYENVDELKKILLDKQKLKEFVTSDLCYTTLSGLREIRPMKTWIYKNSQSALKM